MNAVELRRRPFLAAAGMLLVGAVTAATPRQPPTTFYVTASGDDTADGLTINTAWATIQKVNAALPANSAVMFRRGDTFFGELSPPAYVDVGAFGQGLRPVITLYKLLNHPDGWSQYSSGIWQIDVGEPGTHDGYTETTDANIGHLLINGVVRPAKKNQLSDLIDSWDFWCDTTTSTLYVAADDVPTNLASDIKAAARGATGAAINCTKESISISDLHVTGSGGHGITGTGTNVHIQGCLIDNVGGSFLPGFRDGMVRYGNGIENWIGAKRWLIEKNEIAQVYDSAYTCQGNDGSSDQGWEDMVFTSNYIHDCTQSFEFWSHGAGEAASFKRVLVDGNHCERGGYSAFADFRPNQAVRVHLLTYNWDGAADITIQNNTFHGAHTAYSFHMSETPGLLTQDNTILLGAGTDLQYQRPETIEDAATWQDRTGYEIGSTFEVLA